MSRRDFLFLGLLLAGCGGGDPVVRGTLREDALRAAGSDPLYVWAEEGGDPIPVREGRFEITEAPRGPILLRFGDGEEARARMEIRDLPEGAELDLEGIRIDRESGLAFPTSVRLEGAEGVLVNGLRLAPAEAVPARVEEDGVALAVAREAGTLLFRPASARLPDLRVVVTPGTEVVTPDGDPVDVEELEAGDSLRVEGATEAGLVVARRLVVPRALALAAAGGDGGEREEERSRDENRGERREREEVEDPDDRQEEARGRGEGRGKGKGRGRGKGGKKGKG
jgi:hypothetical protein